MFRHHCAHRQEYKAVHYCIWFQHLMCWLECWDAGRQVVCTLSAENHMQ